MSETFPAVPSDLLCDMVDSSFDDYTALWGKTVGFYFRDGRSNAVVTLSAFGDVCMEAVTAGCYGVSLGADQCVWTASAMTEASPMGEPWMVMLYSDRWGTQAYRRRKLSIFDDGLVVPVGGWEPRETDGSKLLGAIGTPWGLGPGDPQTIRGILEGRGHIVRP